nr:putative nucleotidyltransferase, ribonuclease H [Tanacetum cinerariifolium]
MANEKREAYVPSPELISFPPRQLDSWKEPRAYQQHDTLKEQPPENPLTSSRRPSTTRKQIRLKFSTAFHPQTDGQSERTIQTLEDMLRSCALEWTGNWDNYICLVEFAYNNSWHASIKCAPFEMLYGRKCRASICWDQVGERVIEGPEMIEVTNAKVAVAKEKLKEARTRQKSYADKHRRSLEFQPGDHVFLKVSPARGVRRFGSKGKLSPRFIGPFEILDRVGIQELIFIYGHGGTGKTFLWKTIIYALRAVGKIVLTVASFGITSLLLPSGRTAHSRFKLPLELNDSSTCSITKNTQLAVLLKETGLIIWDESPMNDR